MCALLFGPWKLCQLNYQTKGLVYGLIIGKSPGYITVQQNQIGAFPETVRVFALDTVLEQFTKIVFGRRSSVLSSLNFLIICLSLCTGKPSCTYDADSLATFGMSNHQEPTASRESESDEPIFLVGMIRIKDSYTQRVLKDSSSFSESNAVFPQVHLRFGRVPFELYHALASFAKGANDLLTREATLRPNHVSNQPSHP